MKNKFLFIIFIFSLTVFLYPQKDTLKTYYAGSKLKSVIPMLDGLRHGQSKFYFDNGNLKEERPYINGKVEGVVKLYFKSGKLKSIYSIINGKREGNFTLYDEKGEVLKEVDFAGGKIYVKKVPFYVNNSKDTFVKKSLKKIKEKRTGVPLPPKIKEENFKDDPVYYLNAEVMPKPFGGMATFYKKLYYPRTAIDNDIKGIVKVKAFIEKNGKVSKTEIVKGIGYGCDESASIAVKYTRFSPGLIRGHKVKVQMVISLEFKNQ